MSNSGILTSTGTLGGGLVNLAGGTASIEGTLSGAVGNAGTLTLTGATTGIGALSQTAGGVFDLAGNSTAIGSLAGDGAVLLGSATLTTGEGGASTLFSGVIAGSGGLTNSYTGGTLVRSGRLVGNTAVLQGTIQTDAVLEFAQADAGTFGGALLGSGRVEKTGAGVLTYTGNGSGLTGTFAVLGGGLRLDGRLDNAVVTLASGTQLSGNGVMGGLVAESGAVVAPGASVGRLGVLGDVTFQSGSRLIAEIEQTGADAIVALGTARLAGAIEVINIGGADYIFNSAFDLVVADGGVTGAFDTVSFAGFDTRFRPTLRTSATGVELVLAPNSLAVLAGAALTGNQAAVAARFDAAVLAGFNPLAFVGVYDLAPAQLTGALDQLSGEIHPALGRAAMRQSRLPREAVLERASGVALPDNPQGNSWGSWGKLMRSWGDVEAGNGAASQQTDTEGFIAGFDGGTANDSRSLRFGVYGSYLDTRIRIDARGSNGRIEQTGGGIYASLALGGLSLVAGGGAAHFDITAQRVVALPGLADATSSGSTGDMAQVFGRVGYSFDLGAVTLEPFAAGDAAWIAIDPVRERGGEAAVAVRGQDYTVASASAGIAAKAALGKLRLESAAATRFELGDRAPQALIALAAAPGQATGVASTRLAGTAFTGRFGAVLPLTRRIEVRVDYAGEFANTDTEHTAQAGISIAF